MLEKILAAGRHRGLSQLELERRAGLAGNRIAKIKADPEALRWREVVALARVVGVPLDWLASDAPDDIVPTQDAISIALRQVIALIGEREALRRLTGPPVPPSEHPTHVEVVEVRDLPAAVKPTRRHA